MDTRLYIWCALLGLLGIAFQTLLKINKLQQQSKLANHEFHFADYFKNDMVTVLLNVITLAVAIIAMDEIVKYKPQVLAYIKWCFFFIGYTGSSLLNSVLSKTQAGLNKIIDAKTDLADYGKSIKPDEDPK